MMVTQQRRLTSMLHVQNIEKYYGTKNNVTKALDRVSFNVEDA